MSADIEQADDGRATFVAVRKHGWHAMGEVRDEDLSVVQGLELAHLAGLEYHTEPVLVPVGNPPVLQAAAGRIATVRRNPFDTSKWDILGVGMTEAYTLHTPEEAFGFGEAIIESGHPLAAMGSIANGRKAFAAFHMDDLTIGGTDAVRMYLNVLTSFDATLATYARVSAIRVECSNTFNEVLGEGDAPTYRVRHIGDGLEHRVDDARASLDIGWRAMEQFQKEAELLISRDVTRVEFDKIVERLLPIRKDATDRITKMRLSERESVRSIYEAGNAASISGTAWGVFNAYTEWVDWYAGSFKTPEARMVSQIMPGTITDKRRERAGSIVKSVLSLTA